VCPVSTGDMVLRRGRGGKLFWACSHYRGGEQGSCTHRESYIALPKRKWTEYAVLPQSPLNLLVRERFISNDGQFLAVYWLMHATLSERPMGAYRSRTAWFKRLRMVIEPAVHLAPW